MRRCERVKTVYSLVCERNQAATGRPLTRTLFFDALTLPDGEIQLACSPKGSLGHTRMGDWHQRGHAVTRPFRITLPVMRLIHTPSVLVRRVARVQEPTRGQASVNVSGRWYAALHRCCPL